MNRNMIAIYGLSVFALSSVSTAGEPQKPPQYKKLPDYGLSDSTVGIGSKGFDGAYVGLSVGGDFGKSETTTSGSARGGINFRANAKSDLSVRGASGGVFVGYGKTIKGILLGTEIAGDIYNSKGQQSTTFTDGATNAVTTTVKKTNSFSITGRVGKQLGEKTLIYGKGGLTFPNYKVTSSASSTNLGVVVAGASANQTQRLTQLVAGAGVEYKLAEISSKVDLHIRGEYLHTFGNTTKLSLSSRTFNGSSKFDTSSDEIKAMLLFKF